METQFIATIRQHPVVFFPLLIQWAIYFFLKTWLSNVLVLQQSIGMTGWTLGELFLMMLLLFLLFQSVSQIIGFISTRYRVSKTKLITREGLIARQTTEILLGKIESIQVHQSLLGRLLGYGTIAVQGTGGMRDPLHYVPAPFRFRDILYQQINQLGQ